MRLRGAAGVLFLAASIGCDEPPVGPQPDRPIVLTAPIPERAGPPTLERPRPTAPRAPPPAEPAAPPPAPVRSPQETLTAAWASRATDDAWAKLAAAPKTEALAAALRARAMDETQPEPARQAALDALKTEDPATQREAFEAAAKATPAGSPARALALTGLVSAGGISGAFTHLGESEALDLALLSLASGERLKEATPALRAYQRTRKPTARVQAALKKLLGKPARRR